MNATIVRSLARIRVSRSTVASPALRRLRQPVSGSVEASRVARSSAARRAWISAVRSR